MLLTDIVPCLEDLWPERAAVKDSFRAKTNELSLDTATPFESAKEDEDHAYQTLFEDHLEGEGITINIDLFLICL